VLNPLLDPRAPAEVKQYALGKSASRLAVLESHLAGRTHLLADLSVADAYLVTVLGWTSATPIDLQSWGTIAAYARRLRQRPSFARALAEERPLYGTLIAAT
jgi:glutathione S-transferase